MNPEDELVDVTTPNGAVIRTTRGEAARLGASPEPAAVPSAWADEAALTRARDAVNRATGAAPAAPPVPTMGSHTAPTPRMPRPGRRDTSRLTQPELPPTTPIPTEQPGQDSDVVFAGGAAEGGALPANANMIQVRTPGGPARMVTTGRVTETRQGLNLPPEMLGAMAAGGERAAEDMVEIGAIQSEREKARSAQIGELQGRMRGLQDNYTGEEQQRMVRQRGALDMYTSALENATSVTMDPDRRQTGQQVLSGIASWLGGLAGGTNQVLPVIEASLMRDMAAQRENIDSGRVRADGLRSAYAMARLQGADEREAQVAGMTFELENAAREAEKLAAMSNSREVIHRANIAAQDMRARIDQINIASMARAMPETTTREQQALRGGGGGSSQLVFTKFDANGNPIPGSQIVVPTSMLTNDNFMDNLERGGFRLQSGGGGTGLSEGEQGRQQSLATRLEGLQGAAGPLAALERRAQAGETSGLGFSASVPRAIAETVGENAPVVGGQALGSVFRGVVDLIQGPEARQNRALLAQAVGAMERELGGANYTAVDRQRFAPIRESFERATSDEEILRAASQLAGFAQDMERTALAGVSPRVRQAFEENRRAVRGSGADARRVRPASNE